jgi:tetratricopeptide (TPR) repeat protein
MGLAGQYRRSVRSFVGITSVLACVGLRPALAEEVASRAPTLEVVKSTDLSSRFKVDEANPEKGLPSAEEAMKNPLEMGYLMMDLIARAEAATQRGDHAATVRYYKAIAKAVPERAVSFSKLCKAYAELGDLDSAIDACRQALGKGGVQVEDHARFVQLMLSRERPLSTEEVADLDAVVKHLKGQLTDGSDSAAKLLPVRLQCDIATKLEDEARLSGCVENLAGLAPKEPLALTYRYALALRQQDFSAADEVVAEATGAGLPEGAIASMRQQLTTAREQSSVFARLGWGAVEWLAAVVLCLALGAAYSFAMRRRPGLRTA